MVDTGAAPSGLAEADAARVAATRAVAARLREWHGESEPDGLGRWVLCSAAHLPTGAVVHLGGRSTLGPVSVARTADRLEQCAAGGWRWYFARPSGVTTAHLGCGHRLCLVCQHQQGLEQLARWAPVLDAAVADGCTLEHVTLTQPAVSAPGGWLSPAELSDPAWQGAPGDVEVEGREPGQDCVMVSEWPDGAPARPTWAGDDGREYTGRDGAVVGGEGLWSSVTRLVGSWSRVRQGRGTRGLVASTGQLRGTEVTGRAKAGGVPRYHAHLHVLCVSERAHEPVGSALVQAWLGTVPGASPSAQHVTAVEGASAAGIRECLKYSYKPSTLSDAQLVDALAELRGVHAHQVSGRLHGRSRAAFAKYLRARAPDPEPSARLVVAQRRDLADAQPVAVGWRPPAGVERVLLGFTVADDGGALDASWGVLSSDLARAAERGPDAVAALVPPEAWASLRGALAPS